MNKNISAIFYFYLLSNLVQAHNFNITSIQDIMSQRPDIKYIKCHDTEPFEYKHFPISQFPELQPNKGLLAETFILKIPNGQVCSWHGWIKVDNNIIQDLIFHHFCLDTHIKFLNKTNFTNIKKIQGKVAVITLLADSCYGHWIYNVLGRLALLEEQGIEYDWLYVACDKPYMKETLALWGIDPAKIIQPFKENNFIQADELIVPSHIGARTPEPYQYRLSWIPFYLYSKKWNIDNSKLNLHKFNSMNTKYEQMPPSYVSINNYFFHSIPLCGIYLSQWLVDFYLKKFLPLIEHKNYSFSKKVFISREKANTRKMLNEDEVFGFFETYGFKKYFLEEMSVLDQIALFNQAETVIAASGSSLINAIFCKPNTNIVEIFQARCEACFYYASQFLKLNHFCVKTMDFCEAEDIEGFQSTTVNPEIFKIFINNNPILFN